MVIRRVNNSIVETIECEYRYLILKTKVNNDIQNKFICRLQKMRLSWNLGMAKHHIKIVSNLFIEKNDLFRILILFSIALVIGTYLILTCTLISKDGVYYIERAHLFSNSPIELIKSEPCGYLFLIFIAHKFAMLFQANSSAYTWLYSAQSMTLICRLAALIPLYFIGKLLVGSKRSFWAVLILIILPYPAEFGSDVLREWPHILFLMTGFLFLLWGAKRSTGWMFTMTGLFSGLGFIIRPECAQLVIYGTLWILIKLIYTKDNMSRKKLLFLWFLLLIGFAIPFVPYSTIRGRILPSKLKTLISYSDLNHTEDITISKTHSDNNVYIAAAVPIRILKAAGKLIGEISDNLMHYFMLPLGAGIYLRFRRSSESKEIERLFVPAFVFLNSIMLILLQYYWGYISRRHCLPLIVILIFYILEGLETLAQWFEEKFSRNLILKNPQSKLWFSVLLVTGVVICMPKLLRPMGADKPGYRTASTWLMENTDPEDIIAVPDRRISFYAERKGLNYEIEVPKGAEYLVRIVNEGDEEMVSNGIGQKEYSVNINNQKQNKKKLVIFKMKL